MNGTKAFEKPPLQVRVTPAGTTAFVIAIAEHAQPLQAALQKRPSDLSGIAHLAGLHTQLTQLRSHIDATLRDLARANRPASDPLPPTPKTQPEPFITK